MASAKDIIVKPISSKDARKIIKRYHYSGKIVNNSSLHFGVFLNGRCEGAMQFGPSFDKRKMLGLVTGTKWNGMLELNRMAFGEMLPRNSESRALSVAFKLIKKHYPHVKWVLSFADGTQCGDGTIYRASGFDLIGIKKNTSILKLSDGSVVASMTYTKGKHILKNNGAAERPKDSIILGGNQIKYIYFIDKKQKENLTVPILPFSKIKEMGAGMYKGEKR